MLHKILVTGVLASTALSLAWKSNDPVAPRMGSYVAVKFNDAPLPGVSTLRATNGYRHWIKLEQAVLRLQPNGRFVASFRYFHQHLAEREKPGITPVMSRAYAGRYVLHGATITFFPENTGSKKPLDPFPGSIDASGIHVTYVVVDGAVKHNLKLDLRYDPTYW